MFILLKPKDVSDAENILLNRPLEKGVFCWLIFYHSFVKKRVGN